MISVGIPDGNCKNVVYLSGIDEGWFRMQKSLFVLPEGLFRP